MVIANITIIRKKDEMNNGGFITCKKSSDTSRANGIGGAGLARSQLRSFSSAIKKR